MSAARTQATSGKTRAARVVAGGLGLVAVAVLGWGLTASQEGFPSYSPLRHFISALAMPWNPSGHKLDDGFLYGGGLAALSQLVIALVAWRRGALPALWAALAGAAAGVCIALVGVYNLMVVVPHLIFAGLAGIFFMIALGLSARALSPLAPWSRRARWSVYGCRTALYAMIAMVALGIGWAAYVVDRVGLDEAHKLLEAIPADLTYVQIWGHAVNPITTLEWSWFAVALAVMATSSVLTMLPASRR